MTLDQVLAELELLKDHVNSSGHAAVEHLKESVRQLAEALIPKPEVTSTTNSTTQFTETLQPEIKSNPVSEVPAQEPEPPIPVTVKKERGRRGPYKKRK